MCCVWCIYVVCVCVCVCSEVLTRGTILSGSWFLKVFCSTQEPVTGNKKSKASFAYIGCKRTGFLRALLSHWATAWKLRDLIYSHVCTVALLLHSRYVTHATCGVEETLAALMGISHIIQRCSQMPTSRQNKTE